MRRNFLNEAAQPIEFASEHNIVDGSKLSMLDGSDTGVSRKGISNFDR